MTMTRTDRIMSAVRRELERRRAALDEEEGIKSVGLILILDERTGEPLKVIYRTESQSELRPTFREGAAL